MRHGSFFAAIVVSLFSFTLVYAQGVKAKDSPQQPDLLKNLEYPELLVTPLASERLKIEARNENSMVWKNLWPIQASGVATLVAGSMVSGDYAPEGNQEDKDNVDWASKTALAVGATWVGITTYMALASRPYSRAQKSVAKMSASTKRKRIAKERFAEEAFNGPAKLASRLRYFSVATNLLASVYVMSVGQKQSQVVGGVSALVAITPLMFKSHWEHVAKTHRRYKKRIYGPVSQLTLLPNGQGGLLPGVGFSATF